MVEELEEKETTELGVEAAGNASIAAPHSTLPEGMPADDQAITTEDLETMYVESMKKFREGEVVSGKVVEITSDYVLVDIGYKSEGLIAIEEFPSRDVLEIGARLEVFIDEAEDEDGMPVLSKIKADKIKNWEHVQKIYEEDGVIEGRIVRRVKGGLKVDIGVDAFMPASQLTWRPTSNLERHIGETMEVKIIKLTKRRRNVVVSRRRLLEEQRAGEKNRLLSTIEVGQIIKGEVKNITDFGAFVDVGGIDGLLHVTDMSWGRVKHPSQVVSVGEKVEVMVLSFQPETERISLGLKQKTENPWTTAPERYLVGSLVRGKVVSMTDYGGFIQLEDGIEGMVHVSEMSWTRRVRHPGEEISLDEEVDVMILSVDPQAEKIALGIKQTQPNPWRELEQKFPRGSTVKGLVRNLQDYGAFIELEEDIDALLHISDISWTHKITHPSEALKKGEEVEVKVLSIDPDNEKISVGMKQLVDDPWEALIESNPIGVYVDVEITKLVNFGAFARLENGIEGLIHVSELSTERVNKPEEVLSVGDKAKAKIISIDPNERKIGLSIREYHRDVDAQAQADYGQSGAEEAVSIGDVVGDAVPKSLLEPGRTLEQAANEMMADVSTPQPGAGEPEAPAEAAAAPAPEAPAAEPPTESDGPHQEGPATEQAPVAEPPVQVAAPEEEAAAEEPAESQPTAEGDDSDEEKPEA